MGPDDHDSPRSGFVEAAILAAVALAFLDETVRKSLPGHPVLVTGIKDFCIFCAGAVVMGARRPVPVRYAKFFALWVPLTLISASLGFARSGSLPFFLAVLRTYSLVFLTFAAGYYVGLHPAFGRRVGILVLAGGLVALCVAVLQEYARADLPSFLSTRIYIEKHPQSGGRYVESLFASPQIFAQLCVLLAAWGLAQAIASNDTARQLALLALLMACTIGICLSRIRTGLVMLGVTMVIVPVLFWRTVGARRLSQTIAALLYMMGVVVAFLLVSGLDPLATEDVDYYREASYFSRVFDAETLERRLLLGVHEVASAGRFNWLFGDGAGTASPYNKFLPLPLRARKSVMDSGTFLIYVELGAAGLVAFGLCYVGLVFLCGFRLVTRRSVPVEAVASFLVAALFCAWFLLKSHASIQNGFSNIAWMMSAGLCCAALDRSEGEAAARAEPAAAAMALRPEAAAEGG